MRMLKIWRINRGKNEELKKLEEALPRLKECDLEKVSRLHKAKTGEGGGCQEVITSGRGISKSLVSAWSGESSNRRSFPPWPPTTGRENGTTSREKLG